MNRDCICIIPARGGSKRIPRKNVTDFNGKPLIAWSIETALASGLFEQIVVSTDDAEIAEISREFGAEVPFMRDHALADDFATTAEVILDALNRLPEAGAVCCLYPTAPMITPNDLSAALEKLIASEADCVMSVTEFDFHPLRALAKSEDGKLTFKWPDYELSRSQDLPEMLHDAGAFYFLNVESFQNSGKIIGPSTLGIELPRTRAVDIDTPQDLEFAKLLHAETFSGQDSSG